MAVRRTQTLRGVEYVFEDKSVWDSAKGYSTHKREYLGKMVDGEFIPNKRYRLQLQMESAAGSIPAQASKRTFFGATYLFDAIGEKCGITADLKKSYPDLYKQILSIAYYLILEDRNPLSRFSRWAASHSHPFGKDIPSQRSSELFGQIDEAGKQNFFRLQGKRHIEQEFLAYDTTSVSSYSKSLKQVRYGNNKDHDPLAQINLLLLFGEQSRLPFYFRKLTGNIPDVSTLRNLLADIDFMQLDKVKLVMDRGFFSEDNINALYRQHYKFLIAARTGLKLVQSRLDKVRGVMVSRPYYSSKHALYYDSTTLDWQYTEEKKRSGEVLKDTRRLYLHLYYNDQKATDDKVAFNHLLDILEEELLAGKRCKDHESLYVRYFEISETPVRGIVLTPKQDAIVEAEKNYGYFALMSNGIKDPLEALEIYRSKDLVEKAFGNLKERLSMRRTSVWSEENLEGKLFVQFVALIYLSYIKKAMSDNRLFKDYTMQELLDQLDVIELFEQPGSRPRIGEVTQKQKDLYKLLGVEAPA